MSNLQKICSIDGVNISSNIGYHETIHILLSQEFKEINYKPNGCYQFKSTDKVPLKLNISELEENNNDVFQFSLGGSWNKYLNGSNFYDFTWGDFVKAKEEINNNFLSMKYTFYEEGKFKKTNKSLSLNDFTTNRLEIKVDIKNVIVDDKVRFLKNFLKHKKEFFKKDESDFDIKCCHQNYILKIYFKGDNLRFEMVFLRQELKKYKIFNVGCLDFETVKPLVKRLLKEFYEIIFLEGHNIYVDEEKLSEKEQNIVSKFTNERREGEKNEFIKEAKGRLKRNHIQRAYRLKKRFMGIIHKYRGGTIKEQLGELLEKEVANICN